MVLLFVWTAVALLSLVITTSADHAAHLRNPILGQLSALKPGQTQLPFNVIRPSILSGPLSGTSKLTTEGDPSVGLRITYAGIESPTSSDLITLACDLYDANPNDFFDAISATGESSGSFTLPPLPDLRCNYLVRYIRSTSDAATPPTTTTTTTQSSIALLLAETKVKHSFGLLPTQTRLSFTTKQNEMMSIWVVGFNDVPSRVEWGLTQDALNFSAPSTSLTYKASDLCNAPANETGLQKFISPGYIHRAIMAPLPFSTTIWYRVGSDDHGWSKVRSFTSRRSVAITAESSSLKFLMYADQALPVPFFGPAWKMTKQVVRDIEAGYDAFLLHPGDLGYAMGSAYIWDVWGTLVEPITSRVPYMVTVGNHEYDHVGSHPEPSGAPPGGWHPNGTSPVPWGNLGDDSRGECGVPVWARFNGTGSANPNQEQQGPLSATSNSVYWYSFNEGPVHVIMLSSEHDWRQTSRQYAWLEADLEAVNRSQTPWVVLGTHRMMYETETACDSDYALSLAFRSEVEPLLNRSKVNLMVVGHQHSYERSCPAFQGECVEDGVSGTVHMVVGSAGAHVQSGTFNRNNTKFSLKHANTYGYIRLDVNVSRMKIEFVRTNAGGGVKDGQVWDSVELLPWV